MCRYWWVWNQRWGDLHDPESNMIACSLTTEDIEVVRKNVAGATGVPDYEIPQDASITDLYLDAEITDLFVHSVAKAYGISAPVCSRCKLGECDPNEPVSDLPPVECRYRMFPNKNEPLWYGSYENINPPTTGNIEEDFNTFATPVEFSSSPDGRHIHMAGSATCKNFWGFTQGAYYSGIRAANASLYSLGKQGYTFPDDSKLDRNWCTGNPPFSIGNPRAPK